MITDADTKKLVKAFKEIFPTKEDLKDQKDQILDAVDGKLAIQKRELMEEMQKQKREIIEEVAEFVTDTVVPILDNHEKRLSKVEKKLQITPISG